MKCPYCGGEVPSQSIVCPYCGRENAEGIAFQEEVRRRIERNKLLKPFLIKQKTPELVQRMLTRILLIIAVVNAVLFAFSIGLYLWSAREIHREPLPGSYAELYQANFKDIDDYYFDNFYREVKDFVDVLDDGEIPETDALEDLIWDGHRALEHNEGDELEAVYQFEVAFFRGFLNLTEEESAFLKPNEEGKYEYMMSDDVNLIIAVEAIEKRLKEEALR